MLVSGVVILVAAGVVVVASLLHQLQFHLCYRRCNVGFENRENSEKVKTRINIKVPMHAIRFCMLIKLYRSVFP